jgi:amino acid adenylation domain-containing protein
VQSLFGRFLATAARVPDAPALAIGDREWTYAQLCADVARVAAALARASTAAGPRADEPEPVSLAPLVAVFGNRSHAAYTGLLGSHARGHGHVPLNPYFPPAQLRQMLEISGAQTVLVTPEALPLLEATLKGIERPLGLVLPPEADLNGLAARLPAQHRLVSLAELPTDPALLPALTAPPVDPDAVAVILYTSGSTGVPKGVGLTQRNLGHYFDFMNGRLAPLGPGDRHSQVVPLNFDMSLFDLFLAWTNGGCVCAPTVEQSLALGRFIEDQRISVWFSTPSVVAMVRRQGDLRPGQYPRLRQVFFAGEALPLDLAQDTAAAAPNAILENIYGPTEATLTCTWYRYDAARTPGECENGLVPIGAPNDGHTALVVDEGLHEVRRGEVGELLIVGPQVAPGYWNDPRRTAHAFVVPPGRRGLHYRTGDLVRRPRSADEPLMYLGRGDGQVKIQGVRVELAEVETHVREVTGLDAVAIGWPVTASGIEGVVVYLVGQATQLDWPAARRALQQRLPPCAVPRRAICVEAFPTTSSGKTDRKALQESVGARLAGSGSG